MNARFTPLPRLGLAALITTSLGAYAAAPTTGAYTTDPQAQYVADQATDGISNANNILCYIANTRADAMVNLGQYIAFVDESKCDTSGRSDPGKSSNTSSSGTTAYTRMSLTSTRASSSSPQIVKGHAAVNNNGTLMPVYIYATATAGPSASAPNGEITMDYAGLPPTGGRVMRGNITATANTVSFSEKGEFGPGMSSDMRLLVSGGSTTGSGAISISNTFNTTTTTKTFTFGYNGTYYCRSDGTTEKCFDRSTANADGSVWRYGVYDAVTGARFDLPQPGFPVKKANGEYGFASYWGVWFPNAVSTGDTLTNATDATISYTVQKSTGRLVKYTLVSSTLDGIQKVPFMFFASTAVTGKLTQGTQYEGHWNGTAFAITGQQSCGSTGCFTNKVTVSVTPAELDTATNSFGVNGWSQALGGNLNIPPATLQATTNVGTGTVTYNTQSNVLPGDTSVPTTLKCVRDCPLSTLLGSTSSTSSPYSSGTANGWGDTTAANVVTYTWSPTAYTLTATTRGSTPLIGESALSYVQLLTASLSGTPYQWGMRSGALVDATSLTSMECSQNSNTYCDFKSSALTAYYVFETGLQNWNTSTFLQKADGSYVVFTPPMSAAFTVPANTTGTEPYGDFAGAAMKLQFMGFGQLHGIPGKCFSQVDNSEVSCGPNTRYVPAFSIPSDDNGVVTISDAMKYVKWLERELRFTPVAGTSTSLGITMGSLAGLPAAMVLTGDANDPSVSTNTTIYPGSFGSVDFSKAPAVIHGVVQ